MCRLAAFPPNFPRDEAIEILKDFEKCNTDGTGYVYLDDGDFKVYKWPNSLTEVLEAIPDKFLGHMPYSNGWTLVHLRAASHGEVAYRNTHPFVINNLAFIHNGMWHEYDIARVLLQKMGVKLKGETDSEVAGQLFDLIGPKKFTETIQGSGVFMGLKRNGKLWVSKTSGELEFKKFEGNHKYVLASEFPVLSKSRRVVNGWYCFDKNGELIKKYQDPLDKAVKTSSTHGWLSSPQRTYPYFNYKPSNKIENMSLEEFHAHFRD